ncbi:MAG: protein adenylyltransferase SelO family protein [Microthrixaceae bacterium]|nr:protein adenylyltransferase SelO family protein [Microthrixaceae bacterium]
MRAIQHRFLTELPELCMRWQAEPVPDPQPVVVNEALARDLDLDLDCLRSPEATEVFAGNTVPEGAVPVALGYAGHQFGAYSPRLGDGRALLLGELEDPTGHLVDVHLKGSGRTPFARRGDGKATIGPMLREYVVSEALHHLGVPTTRSLAVVTTGEDVLRDGFEKGAVLTRVAESHVRVGTFEYAGAPGR